MSRHGAETIGLLACRDCDLLHHESPISVGRVACCVRCGAALYRNDPNALDRALALTIAALFLLGLANFFPVMIFSYAGRSETSTLAAGVFWLVEGGLGFVAILVALTSIVFPVVRMVGLLFVLLPLRFGAVLPGGRSVFRMVSALEKWGMLDVYALAILVTVIKLGQLADARVLTGCFALVAAALVILATGIAVDRRDVWRRLEEVG